MIAQTTDKATGKKMKLHNGNYEMLLKVANGQMTQEQFSDYLKTNTTVVSRNMNDWLKDLAVHLESECNRLQADVYRLQAEVNRLQGVETDLKDKLIILQGDENNLAGIRNELQLQISDLQAANSRLQLENSDLQAAADASKLKADKLQLQWDGLYGQIKPLRYLGSAPAVLLLSLFVMVFDIHATYHLCEPELGSWTAASLAFGIGLSVLVFTAAKNRNGRFFAIAITFIVAGLRFDFLQAVSELRNTLAGGGVATAKLLLPIVLTIVPPAVNAVLTSMLEDSRLDQSPWFDWGKVKNWIESFFKQSQQ